MPPRRPPLTPPIGSDQPLSSAGVGGGTPPLERYVGFGHWVFFGSSDPKTGLNDPVSCIMIVSWCLNTFLAILDFFDSYHTLATLCKLENLGNLAFFGNFCVKNGRNCIFPRPSFGSKIRS